MLGEKLGSGASGDVYAAVYRGQDVAVKVRDYGNIPSIARQEDEVSAKLTTKSDVWC